MGPPPETRPPSILHVDIDAFYAAVEVLRDPSLAGRPVIVGGSGGRGVVASCTYEARAFGVHSAMPSMRARRLCPAAVFVAGDHELYADYSRRFHGVLTSFTPVVEGIALDEAFLDVASVRRLWGSGPAIATQVRRRVRDELGLDVSVGVATCKLVAKLASEAAKPTASLRGPIPGTGVRVVLPGDELSFLHPLPVGALWGVGPATRRRLERFGVRTVADLAALPLDTVVGALGASLGRHLHDLAWGRDDRRVVPDRAAKSIGREETYAEDRRQRDELRREIVRLSDAVATRLRRQGVACRTVTLKVRFADFDTLTQARTTEPAVDAGPDVAAVALDLFDGVDRTGEVGRRGVRLLGVTGSNLVGARGAQLSLDHSRSRSDGSGAADTSPDPGRELVARAVDDVRRRFGDRAVGPACLVGPHGVAVKRPGDQQWGPSGAGS